MGLKYYVEESFFDTWSQQMAYVLGYISADGSLEAAPHERGKYLRVTSTDEDRILAIKSMMKSRHKIVRENRGTKAKTRYLLRVGSGKIFDQLMRLGITPRKSLTMEFPMVPKRYLASYVRGYFDGDGCAHVDMGFGKAKRLLTVFTCGSKPFLESLHKRLVKEVKIAGNGLYQHGSARHVYQLRYSTRDSLRLYLLMYPPDLSTKLYLKRKYAIFGKYLVLRNLTRASIRRVLMRKGPVAN